ncbi:MAG: hypothetical protein UY49_C0030G0008 [Microgenomates group bacterium GW2011_GWC1_49_7]|nr:MAG: hypothetical protein UY49_C0030G0008 [Microgenomates group bacterium GW2011_GWC1_49_7]
MKKSFIIATTLSLFFLASPNVFATNVTVGSARIVIIPSEVNTITVPWNGDIRHAIDASITTFTIGGVRYWFNPTGLAHTKYRGPLNQPFQTRLWTKDSYMLFQDPHNKGLGGPWRKIDNDTWTFDGGEPWLVNVYEGAGEGLLAFLHVEQATVTGGTYSPGRSRIGLAWSANGGERFTYLGDIIRYYDNRSTYNVQGAPYIIKDGYFYVYNKDLCPNPSEAVARAPVSDVLAAARQGQTTPWKKYYNGSWESDGLGGPCSPVVIEQGIDHTDAAYSTYTQKYYVTLSKQSSGGSDTWIKLYESSNGIHWSYLTTIVQESGLGERKGYQYVTIVDASGNDNGVVGKSFYVYSAKDSTNATVYRWLITFEGASADLTVDGKVNIFDYNILITNYGKTGSAGWIKADIDRNGKVDIFDYNILVSEFGK